MDPIYSFSNQLITILENYRIAALKANIYFLDYPEAGKITRYKNLSCIIDTGASGTFIHEEYLNKKKWNFESPIKYNRTERSSGPGGPFASYHIPNVLIQLKANENLNLTDMPDNRGLDPVVLQTTPDSDHDIIIGNNILETCIFIYDGINNSYCLRVFPNRGIKVVPPGDLIDG
jgi:hypothetical protein